MNKATEASTAGAVDQPPPLMISRTFHARRETVFKAWSAAEHVKAWFSPETYSVPDARVDMRVGGPFEVCMQAPDGERHWSRGVFLEIAPNVRLVIDMRVTDAADKPLFTVRTEVDFADAPGGTRMDVMQTCEFVDAAMAAPMVGGAREGWRTTLDKLDAEVMRMQGATETGARSVVHATFHLERTYSAPLARVWMALTDETAKAKWFNGPWEQLERRLDVRVGGTERLTGRWENGTVTDFEATYYDVVPGERLVYSYVMHINERKISVSLATMQLKAEGAKTRLMVTEQGAFLDGYDDAGAREEGTGQLLDAIGASLEG